MTQEQKCEYKKLSRQVDEAYIKLFDNGNGGRKAHIKPTLFNNRLERMQAFLITLEGDFTNNRYMKLTKI